MDATLLPTPFEMKYTDNYDNVQANILINCPEVVTSCFYKDRNMINMLNQV